MFGGGLRSLSAAFRMGERRFLFSFADRFGFYYLDAVVVELHRIVDEFFNSCRGQVVERSYPSKAAHRGIFRGKRLVWSSRDCFQKLNAQCSLNAAIEAHHALVVEMRKAPFLRLDQITFGQAA